jgi:uncharacterized alpha-E superfamily protein
MSGTAEHLTLQPLLARNAGNILWLGRYMERIENLARILDVTRTFARDGDDGPSWVAIVRINADEQRFFAKHTVASADSVARFYLLDRDNPTSIQTAIHAARENARTLRALISTEMWLQINVFYGEIRALTERDIAPEMLSRLCAELRDGAQAHAGITEGTFYRDQSWHFYNIGRHLERTDQITRLLDIKFNPLLRTATEAELDGGQWNALLRAAAGYHAYRRVHPHGYVPREVAEFMLMDGSFPRSLGLNLAQLEWHMSQLRTRYHLRGSIRPLERVDDLRALLAHGSIDAILASGLSSFLDGIQRQVGQLHEDINAAFLGDY